MVTERLGFPAASRVMARTTTLPVLSPVKYRTMFRPGFRAFESSFQSIRYQPKKQYAQFRAYRQVRFGDKRPNNTRFQFASNLFMRWAARPTFYRDVGVLTVGTGGFYVYNLEEVPVRVPPASNFCHITTY